MIFFSEIIVALRETSDTISRSQNTDLDFAEEFHLMDKLCCLFFATFNRDLFACLFFFFEEIFLEENFFLRFCFEKNFIHILDCWRFRCKLFSWTWKNFEFYCESFHIFLDKITFFTFPSSPLTQRGKRTKKTELENAKISTSLYLPRWNSQISSQSFFSAVNCWRRFAQHISCFSVLFSFCRPIKGSWAPKWIALAREHVHGVMLHLESMKDHQSWTFHRISVFSRWQKS